MPIDTGSYTINHRLKSGECTRWIQTAVCNRFLSALEIFFMPEILYRNLQFMYHLIVLKRRESVIHGKIFS